MRHSHQQRMWQSQQNTQLPTKKSEYWIDSHQAAGILRLRWMCKFSIGSLHPGIYSEGRDGTTTGFTLCHQQALEHIKCEWHAPVLELVNPAGQTEGWSPLHAVQDRELVAIRKDRRLIPPHNRPLNTISCRTDRRKMSVTGMPYYQTYQKWTHSVPSRPGCQPCKTLEDMLLWTCKYEDFNNASDDSSV